MPQDALEAEANSPVPRYDICALAILCERTVLSGWISDGRMIPLSRMNSLPSVRANCFSPTITKFPFDKTSTTIADIDPVKLAACPALPFPSLDKFEPSVFTPSKNPAPKPSLLTMEFF